MSTGPSSTNEWITTAYEFYVNTGGEVSYVDPIAGTRSQDKMVLLSEAEIEADPTSSLQYYAGWMAYFNSVRYMYGTMLDYLERQYKNRTSQTRLNGDGPKESVARGQDRARVLNWSLDDAICVCEARKIKALTEYEAAMTYRDLVSRIITVREQDRRTTRV